MGLALGVCPGKASGSLLPPYKNPSLGVDERVEDLLGHMTLHEKVMQLQNRGIGNPADWERNFDGCSVGTVHDMSRRTGDCAEIVDSLNRYMANTRLGIPVITCVEGIEGILQEGCTIFPQALAQGSTFNPELVARMTSAAASEARALGMRQVLSPVLDVARELRWGRIEETFGEDPYLISEMAGAFVNGFQNNGVGCMPKHFVAHGSPTGGLNTASVAGGPIEFYNIYLYPFEKVIRNCRPAAIMSCYSAYDGVPVSGSRYYMTDILRDYLGFDGYVYSDWGSVDRLQSFHHAVAIREEAARQSLLAGVDVDVDDAYRTLEEQVEQGLVAMEDIDTAVRRVLRAKFLLGLFDEEYSVPGDIDAMVHSEAHRSLAKEVADESVVLLENDGILPLDLKKHKKIAVIGPNADYAPMGDYSWRRPDERVGITLLDGLRAKAGNGVDIAYAEGCDWWSQNTDGFEAAITTAADADVIVAVVGTRSAYLGVGPSKMTAGEGFDLSSLELPGVQLDLLKELKKLGKPMVVALVSGKPLVLTWAKDNADALLVQWYGGERQGEALADVILGNVNPSGRLNVSMPRSTGSLPCFYNYYPTDKEFGNDVGGTLDDPRLHYVFESPYALYSFGSGRGYSDFEYSNAKASLQGEFIEVSVDVTNKGKMDGKEVVQIYVSDPVCSVLRPVRMLKGFSKVAIPAGNTSNVKVAIPIEELKYTDMSGRKVLEPGDFIVEIGRSSDDILYSEKIEIK